MGSLIYFLIWGALFFVMMRFGCGAHVMGHGHGHSAPSDADTPSGSAISSTQAGKTRDPVCQMEVDSAKSKSAVFAGQAYYFCSADCRGKFEEDPQSYLATGTNRPSMKEHDHAI